MLAMLIASMTAAATTTPNANAVNSIDTIVVEATKRPVSSTSLPTKITLVDQERVQRELAQDIADLVRYEPGVDVVNQGSRFGLSGISIRGVGGNRVHIEVDGVATSDAFSIGSFSNASRDFFDIDSLKQVEILRGPASAMFGSDALGGVVSFVTKSPSDLLEAKDFAATTNAGFNSTDSSLVIGATAAARLGQVAGMLRITRREGGELNVGASDPLDAESLNLLARLDFGDVAAGGVQLTLEDFDSDSLSDVDSREGTQDFTAAFGFPYVINTTVVSANDTRTRTRVSLGQEWRTGVLGLDYVRWRAYQQDSETRQQTLESRETFIAGMPGAVDRNRTFSFEQRLLGTEVNAAIDWASGAIAQTTAFGIEYEQTDTAQLRDGLERNLLTGVVSSQVGPDIFPLRDFPKSETKRMGIYAEHEITVGNVTLTPGLRWDRYELVPDIDQIFIEDNPGVAVVNYDDDQVSPKMGALWQVNESVQWYAQYAEGFRAPPVNDVNVGFTNFQFGYTAMPSPDLRSESSRGLEAGIRFVNPLWSAELATFQTRYDDFIQSFTNVGVDPNNGLLIFQSINLEDVEIAGVEFSAQASLPKLPGITLRMSAAYANGEDRSTGQPLNSIAPLNGVIGIDYANPDSGISGSVVARAAARQDDLDESAGALLSPAGYVVFDALAAWKPTDSLRVRAGVYNLGDHTYFNYLDVQGLSSDNVNSAQFQRPGREFSLALDWSF
ncbi:MAG: TonB-dependent hemoglobin/transferrin/lactoferrin family receptor [Woeseiaceae bacterium]